jgi:hypothetical protein
MSLLFSSATIISILRGTGGMNGTATHGATINVEVQDLISLMSNEVARKVVDDLKAREIDPLHNRIRQLEQKVNSKASALNAIFETLWKTGVVALAFIEAYHYLR